MASPQMLDRQVVELPRPIVLVNRFIWAALLAGQAAAAVAFAIVVAKGSRPAASPTLTVPLLMAITGAMLAFAIVVMVVVRTVGFRDVMPGDAKAVRARYGAMTVIAMAPLEGASFTAMVLAFVSGRAWPVALVSVAAFAIQVSLFPRGTVTMPS